MDVPSAPHSLVSLLSDQRGNCLLAPFKLHFPPQEKEVGSQHCLKCMGFRRLTAAACEWINISGTKHRAVVVPILKQIRLFPFRSSTSTTSTT
jgi:hypothetical protein